MKSYLVGGWVRDHLRGEPSQDRDWVVVGATENEMRAQGFKSVGASFPVFLHPKTKEEYALARLERKVGPGYHGFEVFSAPSVTLEEDLSRRDLTINAMAFDPDLDAIIDPFHGQQDWKNGILRHVSSAFSEDPLRLIRLARFYAVFHHMTIAPETHALCEQIALSGELKALSPERIRLEVEKMYKTSSMPVRFWQLLQDLGALPILFPMLRSIDFYQITLPTVWTLSNPFVAGLLLLKKNLSEPREFSALLSQLRASRIELQLCSLSEALSHAVANSYESLVRMLIQTRSLHDSDFLWEVYHWGLEPQVWSWDCIQTAIAHLKAGDLAFLQDVPPSSRKPVLLSYYVQSLQQAYPSLFQL